MIYACTICDKNYFAKGLALHHSLYRASLTELILYWLCLDDETYERLHNMDLPGVVLVRVSNMDNYYDLPAIRKLPNTNWGDEYTNFCWRITPIFINFLLKHFIPTNAKLIYADSDIYFYHPVQLILDVVGTRSVGIHTHRFSRPFDDNIETGWYNVGVMVFTNNETGNRVSDRWIEWIINPHTDLYKKYGTCGDQKWLNLFIPTFGQDNICVFDEDGDCGHLAPWNCNGVTHPRKYYVMYKGREQPVVFFHFSHFTVENGKWRDSFHGEWNPASDPNVRVYYQQYFETIQSLTMPVI